MANKKGRAPEHKLENSAFKIFLKFQCSYWFTWMKDVIYSKKHKVHIYKYENLESNILKLKSILSLDNEKIKFNKIQLKNNLRKNNTANNNQHSYNS